MRAGSPSLSGATLESAETPASSSELAEGTQVGPWRLERCVGQGAMGSVFEARHVQLGRTAAVKVLKREHAQNPALVQRFFAEARTVNTIDHPHIIQVHDFEDGSPRGEAVYLVMELLRGESLAARLSRGPVSLAEALGISRQVAAALAAAHRVGVVHRDLKPDNIFLAEPTADPSAARQGGPSAPALHVKVLDFGVAKLLTEPSTGLTLDGVLVGTPRYMSPEQAACLETDARTDVYGLGAVMYELVSGSAPFTESALGTLMVEILTRPAPPVGARAASGEPVGEALEALLARCLAKLPDERPASMDEVLEALDALEASPATVRKPGTLPKRRRRLASMTAGALALVALVGSQGGALLEKKGEVLLQVTSTPAGADVVREDTGEALGETPLKVRLAQAGSLPVTLKLEGHQPARHEVALGKDVRLDVQLAPLVPGERDSAGIVIPASAVPPHSVRDAVVNPFVP